MQHWRRAAAAAPPPLAAAATAFESRLSLPTCPDATKATAARAAALRILLLMDKKKKNKGGKKKLFIKCGRAPLPRMAEQKKNCCVPSRSTMFLSFFLSFFLSLFFYNLDLAPPCPGSTPRSTNPG